MSIGSGIFLAGLCLALVALYAITRDRWSWRRIVVRTLLLLVGSTVLVWAGLFAYKWWDERPQMVEALGGVSLGEKRADVVFKFGAGQLPQRLDIAKIDAYLASDHARQNPAYAADARAARVKAEALAALGEQSPLKNGPYVFGQVEVEFKDDVVYTIMQDCPSDGSGWTQVNQVSCQSSGEVIRQKFGDLVRVLCSSRQDAQSDEWRAFDVVTLGTRYYLTKNRVSGFLVARPDSLRQFDKSGWVPCK